jgi:predicted DNA-binding protein YlxM (UPF0122 family)
VFGLCREAEVMAYTKEQWDRAKGYYEAGLSLAKIKEKTGIARNTISQRAKKEQWEQGRNSDYIEAREMVADQKGTILEQSGTVSLDIADEIANDRITHRANTNNVATNFHKFILKRQGALSKLIEKVDEFFQQELAKAETEEDIQRLYDAYSTKMETLINYKEIKEAAEANDKLSVTLGVNQRHANNQVNIQNNQVTQNSTVELTVEEAEKEALRLGVPLSALINH